MIKQESQNSVILKHRLILWGVFALLSYLLCILCSPSFSVWANHNSQALDQNVYHLIGRYWMEGDIPYKDFADLKGPGLYLIYGIASLIAPCTFTGMTFFHAFIIGVGLLFAYESLKLFLPTKWACLAFLSYVSYSVPFGGNPSEYVWAMQHIVYFFILRYLKEGSSAFLCHELILTGLFVGITCYLKYNLIICFFPACLLMLFCSRYKWHLSFLLLALGFLSIILPFLAYFYCTNSLADFAEEYFITSIRYGGIPFGQSALCSSNITLLQEFLPFKYENLPSPLLTVCGGIILILSIIPFLTPRTFKIKQMGGFTHLSGLFLTFWVLYMGPYTWSHYAFSLHPFILTAFIAVFKFAEIKANNKAILPVFTCAALCTFALMATLFIHRSIKYSNQDGAANLAKVKSLVEAHNFITDGSAHIIMYRLTNTRPPVKHFVPQYIEGGIEKHQDELHKYITTHKPAYLILNTSSSKLLIPRLKREGHSYSPHSDFENFQLYVRN